MLAKVQNICLLNMNQKLFFYLFLGPRGGLPRCPEILQYTKCPCLSSEFSTMRDAGFESGTTASEVQSATKEPLHLHQLATTSPKIKNSSYNDDLRRHREEITYINYNNIDRPTKHSLLLTKLTNLISEWKVGWFCRLKKICKVNELC